jgi:hypothetical protein
MNCSAQEEGETIFTIKTAGGISNFIYPTEDFTIKPTAMIGATFEANKKFSFATTVCFENHKALRQSIFEEYTIDIFYISLIPCFRWQPHSKFSFFIGPHVYYQLGLNIDGSVSGPIDINGLSKNNKLNVGVFSEQNLILSKRFKLLLTESYRPTGIGKNLGLWGNYTVRFGLGYSIL